MRVPSCFAVVFLLLLRFYLLVFSCFFAFGSRFFFFCFFRSFFSVPLCCSCFVVQVIYLGDIDFDAPGEATATDILVRQHRTRVRVKRVKDKPSTKKKRKARTWELPLVYLYLIPVPWRYIAPTLYLVTCFAFAVGRVSLYRKPHAAVDTHSKLETSKEG